MHRISEPMKRRSTRKGKKLAETPNLPPDLIEEILSRLPVKSILRFRCVSKYWHALLTTNPNFVQKHLTHTIQNADNHSFNLHKQPLNEYYTITNPTFEKWVKLKTPFIGKKIQICTVGSLNGLICLYHANKRTFNNVVYLWNPAIREYKALSHPKTEQTKLGLKRPSSVGFGYNPATNDYKVVEILSCRQNPDLLANDNDSWCEAEIYSLNANSWRRQVFSDLWFHAYGEFTNGAIHWLVSPRTGKYFRSIFAFRMVDEVFREIPLPICNLPNDVTDLDSFITTSLHTYKERLCVCVQYHMNQNFDVWVLKEYGIKDSWTKLLNFRHPDSVGYIDPVLFFKSGEILFRACPNYEYKLYSYNIDSGHLQKLKVLKGKDVELVPYMESLVRPVACNGVESQLNGSHRGDGAET